MGHPLTVLACLLSACLALSPVLLQLARHYYSSSAQMMADANMIVQAAASYHTVGHGKQATPLIIQRAREVVAEGQTALNPLRAALDYWEGRVQVRHRTVEDSTVHRQNLCCLAVCAWIEVVFSGGVCGHGGEGCGVPCVVLCCVVTC